MQIIKMKNETVNYKSQHRSNRWLKWGAAAACLCLIIGGFFMAHSMQKDRAVISQYPGSSSGCYAAPGAGEVSWDSAVQEAKEEYAGKEVTYLLTFDIFENGVVQLTEEQKSEEYQRLLAEGYELFSTECWTYQEEGEKVYYPVVVGYFTEDQLSNFNTGSQYGYFFHFASNGDGSGIHVNENDLIAVFPTTHS